MTDSTDGKICRRCLHLKDSDSFRSDRNICKTCEKERSENGHDRVVQQQPSHRPTILAIPDLHAPFAHPDSISFLKAVRAKYRATHTVCLGDEIDLHAVSDWVSDPDGLSAGDEHDAALDFLKQLYEEFPKVQVCVSNHTSRVARKAFKSGIPARFLRSYAEILEAPQGWSWHEAVEIDGIRFQHGEPGSGPLAALKHATANMMPTVIGHLHADAGVVFHQTPKGLIWGLNAGCLIHFEAYAFAYAKFTTKRPVVGCGVVDRGVPIFEVMRQNGGGRWTGEV